MLSHSPGMGLEIGLCRRLALLPQGLGAAAVAHQHRIAAIDGLEHQPRQRAALAPASASRK